MSRRLTDFVARLPRHQGAPDSRLWIEWTDDRNQSHVCVAQLVNFSRSGAQLRLERPLDVGTSVTLRIACEETGLHISRQATVRWHYDQDTGEATLGCAFTTDVDWETLGELFLNDLLVADA